MHGGSALHAVENGDELGTVHGQAGAEVGGVHAVHVALTDHVVGSLMPPVALVDVHILLAGALVGQRNGDLLGGYALALAILDGGQGQNSLLVLDEAEDQGCHGSVDRMGVGEADTDGAGDSGIDGVHHSACLDLQELQHGSIVSDLKQAVGAVLSHHGNGDGVVGGDLSLAGNHGVQAALGDGVIADGALGSDVCLGCVGGGLQDDGGPDILAELAQEGAQIAVGQLVIDQAVQSVGVADPGGEVQGIIRTDHQGGMAGEIDGEVEAQVAGELGHDHVPAAGVLEHVAAPDVAALVDDIEEFAVSLSIVAVPILVGDLLVAAGGDTGQIGYAIAAHLKVDEAGIHQLKGSDDRIFPNAQCGGVLGGEALGIGQIPDPEVLLVVHIAGIADVVAGGIHKMHGAGVVVQQVEIVRAGDGGHGHGDVVDAIAPDQAVFHGQVPVIEPGGAGLVHQNAVDIGLKLSDGDGALVVDGLIQAGGGTDGGGAQAHAGDNALAVYGGDGLVGGGEDQRLIGQVPGQGRGAELGGQTVQDLHLLLGEPDHGGLVGGSGPAGPFLAPLGEDQGCTGLGEGHGGIVVIDQAIAGGGINLEIVGVVVGVACDPGQQIQDALVGIVLQGGVEGGLGRAGVGSAHQHGLVELVQGEGIQVVAAGAVIAVALLGHADAVEGTVSVAGQGVGADADGAQLPGVAGVLVDGQEQAVGGDAVDGAGGGIVCHIRQGVVQSADQDMVSHILHGDHIEIVVGIHGHGVLTHSGGCGGDEIGSEPLMGVPVVAVLTEGGPVLEVLIVGQAGGQGRGIADGLADLVGGEVGGIVCGLDDELVAVHAVEGDLEGDGVAADRLGCGAGVGQAAVAGDVVEDHACQILVIGGGDQHYIALGVHDDLQDLGGLVVHGEGDLHGGTLCQGVPVHIAVLHMVFGGQTQLQQALLTNLQIGIQLHIDVLGRIHPALVGVVVEGCTDRTQFTVRPYLAGGGVHGLEAACLGGADGRIGPLVEIVATLGVDGVALGDVGFVGNDGVAAEVVDLVGLVTVDDAHGVAGGVVQVGAALLLAGGEGGIGAHVVHGGLGPVAVIGQHGQAQDGQQLAALGGQGNGLDEGLDVSAVGILLVQADLVGTVEGDGDLHTDGALGGDLHGTLIAAQEQMDIVGADLAVAAEIGIPGIGGQVGAQGHMVQQRLAVGPGDSAVAVEITACIQLAGVGQVHAAHLEGGESLQIPGQQVQIALAVLTLEDVLGEGVGIQTVGNGLTGQVVQREGEGIFAGALGVVAQLGLDHAVVHAVHGQEGGGADGGADVCQTGTLLDDGIVNTLGAQHGLGGAHQQGIHQGTVGQTVIGDIILPEVLGDHGGQARHLGGRHGGAAHQLILVRLGYSAVDGVDVAAGGGDVGLQTQVAGDAEGAEGAHGFVSGIVIVAGQGGADGEGAGAVGQAALGDLLSAACGDGLAHGLGHGDHADAVVIQAVQVGVDDAGLVVVNDQSLRTQLGGDVGLFIIVQLAPGADGDLAGQVHANVVGLAAQTVDIDEVVGGAAAIGRGIQGSQGAVAVFVAGLGIGQGLGVAVDGAVHHDGAADGAVVVHGGHSHEGVKGAGAAHGI